MNRCVRIPFLILLSLGVAVSAASADWTSVAPLDTREVPDLCVADDTLYVAAIATIFSHPAGTNDWIPSAEIGPDIEISRVIKSHGRLFVGTFQDGVFESSSGGASWQPQSTGLSGTGSLTITAFAVRGDSLYIGTSGAGVWVFSLNGGTTWQPFRTGMPWNLAWDVYTLYNFDGYLFAGAGQNATLFRNPPDSSSWTTIQYTDFSAGGVAMMSFGHDGSTLLGSGTSGLFTSTDTGSTWTKYQGPWNPAGDGAVVVTPERIYALLGYPTHGSYVYEYDGAAWNLRDHHTGIGGYDLVAFENRLYLSHFTGLMYTPLDPTDVTDPEPALPSSPILLQNYPNPFNPMTTIAYDLPASGMVGLSVVNTAGHQVTTLVNEWQGRGRHTVDWDATDSSGRRVASGVYFYRLTSGSHGFTRKMVLLK